MPKVKPKGLGLFSAEYLRMIFQRLAPHEFQARVISKVVIRAAQKINLATAYVRGGYFSVV